MNFDHKYEAECNFSKSKGFKRKCQTLYGHSGKMMKDIFELLLLINQIIK